MQQVDALSSSSGASGDTPVTAGSAASSELSADVLTVLVVGGGVSGLCAAIALSAAGCDVHVYERAKGVPPSCEVGVVLSEELSAFCASHKVPIERAVAGGRQVLADDGECAVCDAREQEYISWEGFRSAMLQRLPQDHYHAGCQVVNVDLSDSSSAVIELSTGERVSGHLVVAADGMNSKVREVLLPDCQPTYAGYLAWRGVVRADALSPGVQHLLADKASLYKGAHLHMQVHPLPPAGTSRGGGSSSSMLGWTWFNNQAEEELPGLLLDEQLQPYTHAVPVGMLSSAVADAVAAAAAEALPAPLVELVAASRSAMGVAAISDMALSGCVVAGRVALVGRAGCIVRPHTCSAAQKAVADAASLAGALRARKLALDKALPLWQPQQVQRSIALCQAAAAAGDRLQGAVAC